MCCSLLSLRSPPDAKVLLEKFTDKCSLQMEVVTSCLWQVLGVQVVTSAVRHETSAAGQMLESKSHWGFLTTKQLHVENAKESWKDDAAGNMKNFLSTKYELVSHLHHFWKCVTTCELFHLDKSPDTGKERSLSYKELRHTRISLPPALYCILVTAVFLRLFLTRFCFVVGCITLLRCQSNIHMGGRTQGFPAEHGPEKHHTASNSLSSSQVFPK